MGIRYASRDEVKNALDSKETAVNNLQVDRAIEAASRSVERLTHRKFYPYTGTKYFNYPGDFTREPNRLWLEESELVSISSISSGSVVITSDQYYLEPANEGAPYTYLELRLDKTGTFGNGTTRQRDISITGKFYYEQDVLCSALNEDLDLTETSIDITSSVGVGVGDLLLIDSERMNVTDRAFMDTTVNTASSLTASMSDVALTLSTTVLAPVENEVIQIDSERMLVISVAGTAVTVKRAWDGSVLAVHNSGVDIYAPRNLTVSRGSCGTTAATHSTSAAIYKNDPPGPIKSLTIAYAIAQLQKEAQGYGANGTAGQRPTSSSFGDVDYLAQQVYAEYGRIRIRAI